MFRITSMSALTIALGLAGGCQSAEQECNEARVAAHDAWATFIPMIERQAQEARARADGMPDSLTVRVAAEQAAENRFREQVQALNIDLTTGRNDPLAGLSFLPPDSTLRERGVPDALFRERDEAMAAAQTAGNEAGRAAILASGEAAGPERLLVQAREALDAARGPAIPARDAFRAMSTEDASPELEVALSASETSWEACQSVDP